MSRNESPPFERGTSGYNGDTIDTNDLQGVDWLGKEWLFEDRNPTTGVQRTNRYVRCRVVRNTSPALGSTLGLVLPKRLVKFSVTAGEHGSEVDGYVTLTGERGYPVDEYLPAAGVPINDYFWIVVDGPATVITALANGEGNSVAIGDPIAALSAATSGATTSGRAAMQFSMAATSQAIQYITQFNQFRNYVGRALSARTTNETDLDVLVEVGKW